MGEYDASTEDGIDTPVERAVPRGSCPACGSREVTHLVIGMPATHDDLGSGPDWVRWVGCVHRGWDRECLTCGARWSASDDQRSPRRRDRSP